MIYVDKIYPRIPRTGQARRYGEKWCHLWADSVDELLQFVKKINLNPAYIQKSKRHDFIHFDLTPNKRKLAIRKGATEINFLFFKYAKRGKI